MSSRIIYVLGGPINSFLETEKRRGQHPRSEFNVFADRNDARLVSTDQVTGGHALSLRRRIALALYLVGIAPAFDVAVTSGEDIGILLALALHLRRRPIPVHIILHGSYLQGRKFALVKPFLRRARHVRFLCLSESLRRMMVDVHGFPENRCYNAGYGVDTEFFGAETVEADKTGEAARIVAAGSANRDYSTLIAAATGLGVSVQIAADSLWRPKDPGLEQAAVPDGVTVRSAGSYSGLRLLYAHSSVVVVPLYQAHYASGYAVIAEAMAMGKVVVTTRTEAASDLVVDNETGFYVEPGDIDGLRDKLRLLLGQPGLAREMGARAAARMREHFSLEAYCQRIESIIAGQLPQPVP